MIKEKKRKICCKIFFPYIFVRCCLCRIKFAGLWTHANEDVIVRKTSVYTEFVYSISAVEISSSISHVDSDLKHSFLSFLFFDCPMNEWVSDFFIPVNN